MADASGKVNAFLPAKIDVREGDSLVLFEVRAEVVKEHIELQLDYQRGRMDLSRRTVDKVDERFDLSKKSWVPME